MLVVFDSMAEATLSKIPIYFVDPLRELRITPTIRKRPAVINPAAGKTSHAPYETRATPMRPMKSLAIDLINDFIGALSVIPILHARVWRHGIQTKLAAKPAMRPRLRVQRSRKQLLASSTAAPFRSERRCSR